jgi:hypothetical protein
MSRPRKLLLLIDGHGNTAFIMSTVAQHGYDERDAEMRFTKSRYWRDFLALACDRWGLILVS